MEVRKIILRVTDAHRNRHHRNTRPMRLDHHLNVEIHSPAMHRSAHKLKCGPHRISAKTAHSVANTTGERVDPYPESREGPPKSPVRRHRVVKLRDARHDRVRIGPRCIQQGVECTQIVLPIGVDLDGMRETALIGAGDPAHHGKALPPVEGMSLQLHTRMAHTNLADARRDLDAATVVDDNHRQTTYIKGGQEPV